MYLRKEKLDFRPKVPRSNPYRMLLWATLIVAGLWLFVQVTITKEVDTLFKPTPTPTRTAHSWAEEAQAHFEAGDLKEAINAYQQALSLDPTDALTWAKLAQIQVYSSALLTTDEQRFRRLQEALQAIDRALELAPEDTNAHAVKAFVLDWSANPNFVSPEERERLLNEAENEAVRAIQLDPQNALALAYYAEVLLDQQKWSQAQQTVEEALTRDDSLVDVHRVRGLVQETFGLYRSAIESYERAVDLAPNLTFLYIYIGLNYRQLKVYNKALQYFDQAATINQVNNVKDPIPYIAIAKTYAQQGEFFVAARNAEKALEINPFDPNTYGQLGDIYVRARNYEGALPVLKCVVQGCSAAENEAAIRLLGEGVAVEGLPLTSEEVAWYYLRYGSVLASLDQCDKAQPVLDQVMAAYGDNELMAGVVAENREICRILAEE